MQRILHIMTPSKKTATKAWAMEDYEVMILIMDSYGPKRDTASALLRHLRKDHGKSCAEERFKTNFQRYYREYVLGKGAPTK
jgi:hypothetical protein